MKSKWEKYLDKNIERNGQPLKCIKCGFFDFKNINEYYEETAGLVEFSVLCINCNSIVGHWSYGNWDF